MKVFWVSCFIFCVSVSVVAQFGPQQVIDPDVFGITKIITADVNNNGFQDIITSQKYHNNSKISLFLNNGNGGFGPQIIITTNVNTPEGVAAGDLTGNGMNDLVAISQNPNAVVWFPNTQGTFPTEIVLDSSLTMPEDVEIVDIDNDGLPDIVVLDHTNIVVYYNNGNSTFSKVTTPNNQFEYYAFSIADLDGDGFQDIVIGSGQVLVYMNNNGSFITHDIARSNSIVNTGFSFMLHTADLNGNGTKDLIIDGNSNSEISWYSNDGNGFFSHMQTIETTLQCKSVSTADFDNDGHQDLFAALFQEGEVAWYKNNGQGVFGTAQLISTGTSPQTVATAVADLNNDGLMDIIWAHPFSFHLNTTVLSTTSPVLAPAITVSPNPVSDRLSIETTLPATLTVYDVLGKTLLKEYTLEQGTHSLLLPAASQMYFLRFTTQAGVVVKRVLKAN